jgi:hypothetical protein
MLICPLFVLAWRFGPTIVVVLFGVLRFVLAMVGAVARVVIKVKIDITNHPPQHQPNCRQHQP